MLTKTGWPTPIARLTRCAITARHVVVAGDWHGNVGWIERALRTAGSAGHRDILHVGDFGLWPDPAFLRTVDRLAHRHGIERILVTPGNHEHWGWLTPMLTGLDGKPTSEAVQLSQVIQVLPRGFRLSVGDHTAVSLGGAPSIDRAHRQHGRDWWPEEAILPSDVDAAVAGGHADILLTHDTIDGSGVPEVEAILEHSPASGPLKLILDNGRQLLTAAARGIRPQVIFHGHYHQRGDGFSTIRSHTGAPLRVVALGRDGDEDGNLVVLDTRTLNLTPLPVWC